MCVEWRADNFISDVVCEDVGILVEGVNCADVLVEQVGRPRGRSAVDRAVEGERDIEENVDTGVVKKLHASIVIEGRVYAVHAHSIDVELLEVGKVTSTVRFRGQRIVERRPVGQENPGGRSKQRQTHGSGNPPL